MCFLQDYRGTASIDGAMSRRMDSGPVELFFVSASVERLVQQRSGMCYPICEILHYKKYFAANWKK